MYCSSCGNQITPGHSTCVYCGNYLPHTTQSLQSHVVNPEMLSNENNPVSQIQNIQYQYQALYAPHTSQLPMTGHYIWLVLLAISSLGSLGNFLNGDVSGLFPLIYTGATAWFLFKQQKTGYYLNLIILIIGMVTSGAAIVGFGYIFFFVRDLELIGVEDVAIFGTLFAVLIGILLVIFIISFAMMRYYQKRKHLFK